MVIVIIIIIIVSDTIIIIIVIISNIIILASIIIITNIYYDYFHYHYDCYHNCVKVVKGVKKILKDEAWRKTLEEKKKGQLKKFKSRTSLDKDDNG